MSHHFCHRHVWCALKGLTLVAALGATVAMLPAARAILPSVVEAPDEWFVPEPPATEVTVDETTAMPAEVAPEQTAQYTAAPAEIPPASSTPVAPQPSTDAVTATASPKPPVTEEALPAPDAPTVATAPALPDNADVLDHVLFQHMALYQELRDEDVSALADIGLLWQTAIERSGTIRFAIEKLSRKNAVGDDPNQEGFATQMVRSLARLGGAAGSMWTGTPAGLIGGDMVTDIVSDNGAATSPLTQVTDADMVLLAKEVESLQSELIDTYYGYRHARKRYSMAEAARDEILRYETVMNAPDATSASKGLTGLFGKKGTQRAGSPEWAMVQPLIASVSESLGDDVIKAQQELLSAREALVLMVGNDAVATLEQLHAEQQQTS